MSDVSTNLSNPSLNTTTTSNSTSNTLSFDRFTLRTLLNNPNIESILASLDPEIQAQVRNALATFSSIPDLPEPSSGTNSPSSITVTFLKVQFEVNSALIEGITSYLKGTIDLMETANQKDIAELEEQIRAEEEGDKWDKVAEAFSWVAVAVMAIATVASFGSAGFALMAIATSIMLVQMIDQKAGLGIMDKFGEAIGSDLAANLIVAGVVLVLSVGSAVQMFKAASVAAKAAAASAAAAKAGTASASAAQAATAQAAAQASAAAARTAAITRNIQAVAGLLQGALTVGSSAANIASAQAQYKAAIAQMKQLLARAEVFQAQKDNEFLRDLLEKFMEANRHLFETGAEILATQDASNSQIIATI